MPYSSPAAVTSGAVISKTTFGDVVKADLDYLSNPPTCIATHNTTQSIAHNTLVTVALNAEEIDTTGTMHNNVTNNSRITLPDTGVYVIEAWLIYPAGTDWLFMSAFLRVNGTTFIGAQSIGTFTASDQNPNVSVSRTRKFVAGDYVEVQAWHKNSGAAARSLVAGALLSATWNGLG